MEQYVWSSPDAVKSGDTALLAQGMTIYDYMYKIETPEYDRAKVTTENLVQEVGSRPKRCQLAHDYDRAMTWSCSVCSQAFSPCTPWGRCIRIMDVVGREGQFLSRILKFPRPRRPRGSQSGREKRRDERFQVRTKKRSFARTDCP